jgi:PmbA protein
VTEALIEAGVRALEAAGARCWEVCVTEERSASVEVVDGAVRAEESSFERAVGLRVLDGGIGFAGLADPTPEGLARAATAALAEARWVRRTPLESFGAPERHAHAAAPPASFADPRATGRLGQRLAEAARVLEARARREDRRVVGVRPAQVTEVVAGFRLRTSAGLDVAEVSTRALASVAALAETRAGRESQLAYAGGSAGAVEALDVERVAQRAARRAVERLGAGGFRTAVVPVVLAPEVVAELLEVIATALTGDVVDRGASFLARALGQQVFGPELTLLDDPHDPTLDGAAWFDGEGLATCRTALIDGGRVVAILDDRETAARGGRVPGGHAQRHGAEGRPRPGAHALCLVAGHDTTAALLARAEGGLWIDEISGTHTISEITGAFSLGATGARIESGRRGRAVEGVTLSGSLLGLFGPGAHPGAEVESLGYARVPPVAVEAVQVASAD